MARSVRDEERFCPSCFDHQTGRVTFHELYGINAWTCGACDYTDDIDRIPRNLRQCLEWIDAGQLPDDFREGSR